MVRVYRAIADRASSNGWRYLHVMHMLTRHATVALFLAFGVAPAILVAQAAPSATTAGQGATRADLGEAYLRLDVLYARADSARLLPDSLRASVNRAFDRATLSFFGGRFGAAVAAVDSATAVLSAVVPGAAPSRRLLPAAAREVRGKPASSVRDALLARLARVDSTGPLAQAVASARARVQLLVDQPSRERTAELLVDPDRLARETEAEVAALERRRNPYVGASGDRWRVLRGASGLVPMRVVVRPPSARITAAPGVLIVLHGAGGDENMFVDGYGAGIAASLAAASNLVLVSPATAQFSASPDNLDSLVALLRAEHKVDTTRVYVMGHSMGASATARLVQLRPSRIAAAICLAGGSPVTVTGAPPMLFIGAALDPVIPARAVEAAARATPTARYELLEHEGHTLMVRQGVQRGVAWMLGLPRT